MTAADTTETNALYVTPEGAFDRGLPAIPAHRFDAERERALDPETPTGIIALDLSAALNIDWPATTPELLAHYLVIRPGERLSHRFQATGEMHFVLRGAGRSTSAGVTLEWRTGDGFCFPGGAETVHQADEDTLIVSTTDEPHHRHFRTQPVPASESFLLPAVFRQDRIDAALGLVHGREGPVKTAGKYVTFSTGAMDRTVRGTLMPTMLASINTLEAGGVQKAHIHNAVAITVSLQGEGVHSMIGETRIDWLPWSVMLTPPLQQHSHHNEGTGMMRSFVVQDGPLFYHLRATGFRWPGPTAG